MQQTLIIADLHLTQVENEKIELFNQFCTEYASKVDQLFILGDLFNTWIGDDISLNTYQSITTMLNKLTKTTQVFVLTAWLTRLERLGIGFNGILYIGN